MPLGENQHHLAWQLLRGMRVLLDFVGLIPHREMERPGLLGMGQREPHHNLGILWPNLHPGFPM